MDIVVTLLPFIVLVGAMWLMTRSAKNKQRAAAQLREGVQPGTGVRTIGGLYARVKETREDTVVLELAPGVHATFAKNAVGAVLEDDEYDRIVNGTIEDEALASDDLGEGLTVPDSPAGLGSVDLGKDSAVRADDGAEDEVRDDAADEDPDESEPAGAGSRKNAGRAGKDDEEGPAGV
ncbi:preprotein translocase subunit YajC [Wenjunlia vitaminophila]|nr:preprotein translocase subunit YajC [Wenjunlia vitaminophila]